MDRAESRKVPSCSFQLSLLVGLWTAVCHIMHGVDIQGRSPKPWGPVCLLVPVMKTWLAATWLTLLCRTFGGWADKMWCKATTLSLSGYEPRPPCNKHPYQAWHSRAQSLPSRSQGKIPNFTLGGSVLYHSTLFPHLESCTVLSTSFPDSKLASLQSILHPSDTELF